MTDRTNPGLMRRWTMRLLCAAGCIGVAGCASPGVPRPPSLKLPELARGLAAERIGDEVRLRWMTPSETTDGETIRGRIEAVVCREAQPSGPCVPVERQEVVPGASTLTIKLAGALAAGPARLLDFRVELQNARGRSAGTTQPVYVVAGTAPGPIENLQVTSTREGALLRWQKLPDGATVEVRRELVEVPKTAPGTRTPVLFGETKDKTDAVVLRAGAGDAGGMVDREAARSVTYRYTAQRLFLVHLGGKDLALRGPESAGVVWMLQDVFPPAAPTGLVAVPGPDSIDLSWDVGPETDLLGYFVVRRSGNEPDEQLNAEAVVAPAFRDSTVVRGKTYRYRVFAADRNGNRSRPSAEVEETLR